MNKQYTPPKITVVIPTRNNPADLIDCLESLLNLDYDLHEFSVIIWDNNSDQEIKGKIKTFLAGLRQEPRIDVSLIESSVNLGGFTSRDELFKRIPSTAEYILSLDDDVILPKNLLKNSLRLFTKGESVGIVGPKIVYDEWPSETVHGAGFIDWYPGRYTTKDSGIVIECDYVIGCCMLIRKQVFDEIGGFDHDYYTSHGEVDFCIRAKKKGFKVLYYPGVIVRHRVDKGGTRSLDRLYYVYRNKLLIIKKNWPVPQKWVALFIYSIFWFPKAIIDSLIINKRIDYPEIKIIIRAMLDGWMNRFGKRI